MDGPFVYPLTSGFTVVWSSIWSILQNGPCVHENNVYSTVMVRTVLYLSIRENWSVLLSKPSVSLLIFSLAALQLLRLEYWNLQLFMYFEAVLLSLYIFIIVIASRCIHPFSVVK